MCLALKRYIVPLKQSKVSKFTSIALVIEKSKPNILMVINDKIWNCSKGDNSNIFVFIKKLKNYSFVELKGIIYKYNVICYFKVEYRNTQNLHVFRILKKI